MQEGPAVIAGPICRACLLGFSPRKLQAGRVPSPLLAHLTPHPDTPVAPLQINPLTHSRPCLIGEEGSHGRWFFLITEI